MKPYYQSIKKVRDFLRHYDTLYKRDYQFRKSKDVLSLMPISLKGQRLLEVGCGGAFYSQVAKDRDCKDITLLDFSLVSVQAAKLRVNGEAIIADAAYLPFKKGSFDFVLCVDLIEHVHEDKKFVLDVSRVLSNGGTLLMSTQNSRSLNYLIEMPIQRYLLRRHWCGWDPTHIRFYTARSLYHLLEKQGLIPVLRGGTYFIPYKLANNFARMNKSFSRGLYYVLKGINDKLGPQNLWSSLGWGLVYTCRKSRSFRTSTL